MFWSAEVKHGREFSWINYDCVLLAENSFAKYMVPCMRKKSNIIKNCTSFIGQWISQERLEQQGCEGQGIYKE